MKKVYLSFLLAIFLVLPFINAFAGGDGSSGNPYQITNWTDLNDTRNNLTASYILTTNLNTSGDYSGLGDNWMPIGTGSGADAFSGSFNGNGKTISNLTINLPETDNVGLFGYVTGNISNINLNVDNATGQNNVGGLVGLQFGGIIDNSFVIIFGTISAGNSNAAGLVGSQWVGTISNSYITIIGTISASGQVGGIVGYAGDTISNSSIIIYNSAILNASNDLGLIVGSNSGIITSTYATIIDSQYGNITFLDWNVTKADGGNLLDSIYINNNSAYVNGSIAGLNKSANITLNLAGWGIKNPQIKKDGVPCSNCNVLSYNTATKIIVFSVTGWSNYSIGEAVVPTVNPTLESCNNIVTGLSLGITWLIIFLVVLFSVFVVNMIKHPEIDIDPAIIAVGVISILVIGLGLIIGIIITVSIGGC
jgi:hypothetical protein